MMNYMKEISKIFGTIDLEELSKIATQAKAL